MAPLLRRARIAIAASITATVLAACGGGGGNASGPPPGATNLVISGTATYDSVPPTVSVGLAYAATTQKPIRGATVQLLSSAGSVIATTTTDAQGAYSVKLPTEQAVRIRVRAEIKQASTPTRDFTVLDNTSGNAPYVLDSAAFTPTASSTQNLHAASGWGGSSYTSTRAAGPFAILDVVYAAQAKIATAASVDLPPLKLYWSPNNRPVNGDPAAGDIGTSFFSLDGTNAALYILGKEDTDTDEYDTHVVAHEFGHYLQSALSRDDSPGGAHSSGDRLDMRLAFSEGWGNAWSGMALGDPLYIDTTGPGQASGSPIDVSTPAQGTDRGWYSETTAQYLLWTLHQNPNVGFAPIYTALRALTSRPTWTSLYSFASELKAARPSAATTVTSLWAGQQIVAQDALGTGETNNGGNPANLPVYLTHMAAAGAPANYCVRTDADQFNDGNKLGRYVYIRFTASGLRTLTVTRKGGTFGPASDPDFVLLKSDGTPEFANAEVTPTQTWTTTLPTGTHVLALEDYNLTHPSTSCFDFTVSP